MFTIRKSRAFARLLFVVSIGLSAQAQAHGPRHAAAFIETVPQNTALECRKTEGGIAYTPGPRGTLVPRVICSDPSAAAVKSPAAQGLFIYGPRNTLFLK